MHVDCNACGATLDVAKDTRFVTCGKCSKRLVVNRAASAVYTEVLGDASEVAPGSDHVSSTPSITVIAPPGNSESVLRVVVGACVVASDIYWFITNPSMQSFYVRMVLLAAGSWLVLSGVWRIIANGRARLRARHAVQSAQPPELEK